MSNNVSQKVSKVVFLTIAQFKKAIGASSLRVVNNENSGKLSVLADETHFFRCQQDLDPKGQMAFLCPDEDLQNACLVNTKKGNSPLKTIADLG